MEETSPLEIPTIPTIPITPVLNMPVLKVQEPEKKEDLVKEWTSRSNETGDEVYLMKDYYVIVKRTRQHITSPEALKQAGFELGQEKTIIFQEMQKYERLDPIVFQKTAEISIDPVQPEDKAPEDMPIAPPTIPPVVYQGNNYSQETPVAGQSQ